MSSLADAISSQARVEVDSRIANQTKKELCDVIDEKPKSLFRRIGSDGELFRIASCFSPVWREFWFVTGKSASELLRF